jgi:high-affinity iron transporter
VVSYLNKSGRPQLIRTVYFALGAAVLASIAGAAMFKRLHIDQDKLEGWVLLIAALFVASMIYWMQRTAHSLKRTIEQRLENISSREETSRLGIFLFVFLMVFREGAETVLMLSAVSLNSDDLMNFFAAVAGLGLAVVFGIIFVRGTVRLDLRKFFKVTTAILICVVLQLTITGLHELSESHVLPSSPREMALIGPIVSNSVFFFVTILALAALMVLFDWRSRQHAAPAAEGGSHAAQRKQIWESRREKLWTVAVCVSSFVFVLLVTAEFIYAKNETALSPSASVASDNGLIRIPLDAVSDGNLHRFVYSADGANTRFIVIKTGDRLATALDACDICGSQGYYQKGASIFCKNCSSAIYGPTIGTVGGCNPVPLSSKVEGASLVIRASDLETGSKFFSAHEKD